MGSSLTLFNEQLALKAEPLHWPGAASPSQLGAQHQGQREISWDSGLFFFPFPKHNQPTKLQGARASG